MTVGLLAVVAAALAAVVPPPSVLPAPRVALGGEREALRPPASLPLPRSVLTRAALVAPHHDYPAVDLPTPEGTPVLAPRAGRARRVEGPKCGLGVVIVEPDGARWTACHLSLVALGRPVVAAGDVLGLSGDTGNARGAPHLHLHLRDRVGTYRCPQPLLAAWWDGDLSVTVPPMPPDRCSFPRG